MGSRCLHLCLALMMGLPYCAQFDAAGSPIGFLLLNGGGAGTGSAASSAVVWNLDGWSRRRVLTLDATSIGSTLSNFPLLVQLDSTRIDYAETQSSGEDLRFLDADGNQLSHEIESWNAAGTSIVWVKHASVPGGTSPTIEMYYGNASAADGQNATDVWSEGYNMVLHLNETTGNGGTRSDSSGTVTAGTLTDANGNSNASAAGKIGTGDQLNGDADSIDMGTQASFALTTFTISGWFQTTCPTPFCTILSRNVSQTNRNYYLGTWDGAFPEHTAGELAFRTSSSSSVDIDIGSVSLVDDGAWHYFIAVFDGTTLASLYVDGGSAQTQVPAGLPNQPAQPLVIGHDNFTGGARYFAGSLDEIRLASVARSADWAALQYLSQSDGLVSFGAEETEP